jgi:hypothetical protein
VCFLAPLYGCKLAHIVTWEILGVGQIEKLKEACEKAHGWFFIFFCVIEMPGNLSR